MQWLFLCFEVFMRRNNVNCYVLFCGKNKLLLKWFYVIFKIRLRFLIVTILILTRYTLYALKILEIYFFFIFYFYPLKYEKFILLILLICENFYIILCIIIFLPLIASSLCVCDTANFCYHIFTFAYKMFGII